MLIDRLNPSISIKTFPDAGQKLKRNVDPTWYSDSVVGIRLDLHSRSPWLASSPSHIRPVCRAHASWINMKKYWPTHRQTLARIQTRWAKVLLQFIAAVARSVWENVWAHTLPAA